MVIKILIGADICPTKTNYNLFSKADIQTLLGQELTDLLKSADYTIFNLELPLTDEITPIAKNGPVLVAPTSTINGLKAINPHFFTLANNHILDQDVQGLNSTINLLKQAGISYSGVGNNIKQANKPYITNIKGIKLGIYCCTEHEFSIATENSLGANPYDPLVSFDTVRELKKQCDFIIVLYHGGKEHYRYPSPQLQRVFHKFADCGADLVVAQHSHCIGCYEKYNTSTLVYGQGNFLFDHSNDECWQTNLLIQLEIDISTNVQKISFIPCVKAENDVRLADIKQADDILKKFNFRSEQIKNSNFIEEEYRKFTKTLINSYLQSSAGLFGRNIIVRIINKIFKHKLFYWLYNDKDFLRLQNIVECEAHREAFLYALKKEKRK